MILKKKQVLARFEGYARGAMAEWQVPGVAVAIVEGDRTIYARGFGSKKAGSPDPVDEKTVFQIGSVSKSFTAALVSMLVDDGKVNWKDKVKAHLPDFCLHDPAATREFTVEDLMSQRSGLPAHAGRLLPHLGFNRDYIIKSLRYIKPAAAFRGEYAYQNNLFLVAAALVEKYSGKCWERSLQDLILSPLEMKHTTTTFLGWLKSGAAAHGHYYNGPGPGSQVIPIPMDWPNYDWVYTIAPAGGINSNVLDMTGWLKLHLGEGVFKDRRLISRDSARIMHAAKINAGQDVWGETRYYCLGWVKSEYHPCPIFWHNGGTSGMKSMVALVPEAGIGIVVHCNLCETLLPEALCRVFFDLWFNNPLRDWSNELLEKCNNEISCLQEPEVPYTPPRPLAFYAGTFYSDLYGAVTVSKTGRSLTITLGPKKIRLKLKHWGGDTFALHWPGVMTNGAGIQFYANRTGIVDKIEIAGMNDDLAGVFIRRPF